MKLQGSRDVGGHDDQSLSVRFKDLVVEIKSGPGLSFSDIDSWTRQRFNLPVSEQLAYYAKYPSSMGLGSYEAEIIPNGSLSKLRHIEVKVVEKKIHFIERKQLVHPAWKLFIRLGPFFLIIMFAWALVQDASADTVSPWLERVGLVQYRKLFIEAFIGFICWSISNLFIRRLGNPETFNGALDRFCADAYFGGFAAGLQSMMKVLLHTKFNR